jgi:hypothetical protein
LRLVLAGFVLSQVEVWKIARLQALKLLDFAIPVSKFVGWLSLLDTLSLITAYVSSYRHPKTTCSA